MKTPLEEVNEVLLPGEIMLMTARQSYLSSISPDRIYVTDKRMIEIHHSFWGLYTGHNLFNVTKVNMVGFDTVKGVIIEKGKILSSLKVRSRIAQEAEENQSEWGIDGLRHHDAELMLNLVQDILQNRGTVHVETLTFDEAKKMADKKSTKFVWLGVQDYRKALGILGIDPIQFTTLLPSDVGRLSKTELQNLEGSILVDYNGAVSISMARYLKKEHGIDAFVLDGGLLYVKRKAPTTPAVVKSMEKDVAQITQTTSWTARNAPSIGRVAEILFGCAWLADALVKINSNFYTQVTSIINAGASGEPTFMHLWVGFWAGLSAINPALFASIVIILEMILGIFLITGFMRKQIYRIGFVYSLLLWSVPEGLGGPYNNPAIVPTDIGTGIIYAFVFVFVAIINSIYGSNKYTIDNFLERHVAGWERIAEIKY